MSITIKCKKCGCIDGYLRVGDVHTGLHCSKCKSWIKWVSKNEISILESGELVVDEFFEEKLKNHFRDYLFIIENSKIFFFKLCRGKGHRFTVGTHFFQQILQFFGCKIPLLKTTFIERLFMFELRHSAPNIIDGPSLSFFLEFFLIFLVDHKHSWNFCLQNQRSKSFA